MTNTELLEARIIASGKKKGYLAEKIGLSPAGFRNCCTNKAEFRASQIHALCAELNIGLDDMRTIFFDGNGAHDAPKERGDADAG